MGLSRREKLIVFLGLLVSILVPIISFSITGLYQTELAAWSEQEITVLNRTGFMSSLFGIMLAVTTTTCLLIHEEDKNKD